MQTPILELSEIIWEITGRCNNHCDYCGSKDIWNETIEESVILKIADEIAKYPPKQIDISGGDPTLVSLDIHKQVYKKLKDKQVFCKMLLNPKSLANENVSELLKLYDYIGISVNNLNELKLLKSSIDLNTIKHKITIITNFNLENIFEFDNIKQVVKQYDLGWQIQYTVYKESDKFSLYENDSSLKFLKDKINMASTEVKLVLSDNMTRQACTAGRYSIGILSTGDVVPCLSMRSWTNVKELSQGNLLTLSLEDIWKTGFTDYRFKSFKCCKDHCGNKAIDIKTETEQIFDLTLPYIPQTTCYYAVMPLDRIGVYTYAVKTQQEITLVYGVSTTTTYATSNTLNTDCGYTVDMKDKKKC